MTRPLTTGLLYASLVFLLFPIAVIVPISFTPERYLSFPGADWSLRHYESLFTSEPWLSSFGQSIGVGLGASAVATVLAGAFGIGLWYARPRGSRLLIGFVMLPMIVPPVVSALVFYFAEGRVGLIDTWPGLILAHAIMAVPYCVICVLVSLSQLDRNIELAARNVGASLWQTTIHIVLPNIRPGLISGAFLAFIISWEEIVVTLFISGINMVTLPKRIWDNLRYNIDPTIAAVSVIMIVVTIAIVLGRFLAQTRRLPGQRGERG
jgi:putative spermidine/putrescine transport system permease protein